MLTEGVDLPDARTAFLSRPTTSRILLRQMIGRVLRGPRAGGDAEANLVYFNDQWRNFTEILEPPEVIEDLVLPARAGTPVGDDPDDGVIIVDVGQLGEGPLAEVRREFNAATVAPMMSSQLAGYYELPGRHVPIFQHQLAPLQELLDAAADGSLKGTPFLSFFENSVAPYPTARTAREMVDFVREFGEAPPFVELAGSAGPELAADRLATAGALTDQDRASLVREIFEASLNKVAYPSLAHFEQAVEQELRDRRTKRLGGEREVPAPTNRSLKPLPQVDRDLEFPVNLARQRCEALLPIELVERFDPPSVTWTTAATSSFWGAWSIKLVGRNRGAQTIRINRLLRTSVSAVSDEMLAYLIYHEFLHHLLPGQGHDADFREFEARWPDAGRIDAEFDSLHERWDTTPSSYSSAAD